MAIRCHGHTLGHYLSAASLMYASTGDPRMKAAGRLHRRRATRVSGSGANGPGLCVPRRRDSARQRRRGPQGRRRAVVHVAQDLRRACATPISTQAARSRARGVDEARRLDRHGDGADDRRTVRAHARDRARRHERGARRRGRPHRRAQVPRRSRGASAIRRCSRRSPKDAIRLDGLHANTQIPKVVGFQRLFELTGEERYARAARFFWRTVAGRRSFVTGGHGDNEHFFPPAEFATHLPLGQDDGDMLHAQHAAPDARCCFSDAPSVAYADLLRASALQRHPGVAGSGFAG